MSVGRSSSLDAPFLPPAPLLCLDTLFDSVGWVLPPTAASGLARVFEAPTADPAPRSAGAGATRVAATADDRDPAALEAMFVGVDGGIAVFVMWAAFDLAATIAAAAFVYLDVLLDWWW